MKRINKSQIVSCQINIFLEAKGIDKKRTFIKDDTTYYMPHIELRLSNGETKKIWFRTSKELFEYEEKHLSDIDWIK